MAATEFDIAVIGAGIAGVSAAAELAACSRVLLLESEPHPGYHATGRSAAFFASGYGPAPIRVVTAWSAQMLQHPPQGFADVPLIRGRDCIFFAREDQRRALEAMADELGAQARLVDGAGIGERVPVMRRGYAVAGLLVQGDGDLDVDALLQGYLRLFRRRGGKFIAGAEVSGLERLASGWQIHCHERQFRAGVVVNAAGAWADRVAGLAGLAPVGLEPRRRTACLIDMPVGVMADAWPLMVDVEERFYFKPDAGRLLLSPADATPSDPCDAMPDDLDVAVAVDRLERATTLNVTRLVSSWAGLRTFAADGVPVVGFDPRTERFFWLAGQGGYGVQSAPGLAVLTAHMITGAAAPAAVAEVSLITAAMSPARLLD